MNVYLVFQFYFIYLFIFTFASPNREAILNCSLDSQRFNIRDNNVFSSTKIIYFFKALETHQ